MWRREWGMGAAEHTSRTHSMRAGGTHLTHSTGAEAPKTPPSHPTPQCRLPSSIRNLHIVPRPSRPFFPHTHTSFHLAGHLVLPAPLRNFLQHQLQ